ncbi:BtpA/SgcQ family protein [Caproiciproducens galactitolivorans]|uniref:BtpA/SgcQ family protein n=1 Tax=Caproiciproducens galactitolivorans TaxID=642589 RepID=A0ABT4BRZ5_9FIRM|nr:BtpA/SgcQ family protein [Caproiciproducens galactitolivorans]MCY1713677.1 BtpA/SgcQ family protein [Caproiciproducens galactitolivorans]
MSWIKDLFHTEKPIIGLLHLRALPGDPSFYINSSSMGEVIKRAKADLKALQDGGVDGVLITNEFSLPYQKKVSAVTLAAMGRVVGALADDLKIPYGVEAIYDPDATIEICAATDAQFTRCMFTGGWVGDLGVVDRDIGETMRLKSALRLDNLRLTYFINGEGEVYLNDRSLSSITQTMIFNCAPDCLVVAGGMAGSGPETSLLAQIKAAAGETPVFCGTGCNISNVESVLRIADGSYVGTTFKENGEFDGKIDGNRVSEFMKKVHAFRKDL